MSQSAPELTEPLLQWSAFWRDVEQRTVDDVRPKPVKVLDLQAEYSMFTLRPLLKKWLDEWGGKGIISLGLPRILEPHMDLLHQHPVLVMEKHPHTAFRSSSASTQEYLDQACQCLVRQGFASYRVVCGDIAWWSYYWRDEWGSVQRQVDGGRPPLVLLDSCNVHDLGPLVTAGDIPSGSLVMLNTCDRRSEGAAWRLAHRLDLGTFLDSVWHPPRGVGPHRRLTFWRK